VLTLTLLRAQNNLPPDDIIGKREAANPGTTIEVTEVPFGQLFDKIAV
jgi:ABC-type glycerol-3-phosphate transport system substrate-binding protein